MSRVARFIAYSLLLVLAGIGIAAPFLDDSGRRGLFVAGGIAWAVQGFALVIFHRLKDREHGFLFALLGGAALRFGALGVTGAVATLTETGLGLEPLILGLAGFTAPLKGSCKDHEGAGAIFIQQWDGENWTRVSDLIPPMTDVVRPMLEDAANKYLEDKPDWETQTCG